MTLTQRTVAVLGAGSWGTALAIVLARNGARVLLWGRDGGQLQAMVTARCNERYLPGIILPAGVEPCADLQEAVKGADDLLLVIPSHAFRHTLCTVAPWLKSSQPIAWATKGLEPGTRKLLDQVVRESLGTDTAMAIISGPTFAREVACGLPTAVSVAGTNEDIAAHFARMLHDHTLRAYTCTDLIGVQIGGAVKNVLALAAGIADGLGYGANTRAALITRGLAEMMRLGAALGGHPETFMGLTGLGDLVLTCTDDQSRNRRVGLALGQGMALADAIAQVGQAVEGVKSAPEVRDLARSLDVEMPITEQVCRVLLEGATPHDAVRALLTRQPKPERAN